MSGKDLAPAPPGQLKIIIRYTTEDNAKMRAEQHGERYLGGDLTSFTVADPKTLLEILSYPAVAMVYASGVSRLC